MRSIRCRSLIVFVLITAIAACGGGGGADLPTTLKLNEDPDSTLLTIESAGGFVPVDFVVNQGPSLVLQRDGTVISQGPQIEIYPGPLLANWQTSQLDEETMLFVLEELDAIGFADFERVDNNEVGGVVADAPTTVVTFHNQEGTHVFSVYALGFDAQGITDARVPILAALVQELYDAAAMGGGESYQPSAIQVVATNGEGLFDPNDPTVNYAEWPLPQTFDEMTPLDIEGWHCSSYEGAEAQDLLAIFSQANQQTYFTDGDVNYRMLVRPLFPGEEACAPTV
jgi:hypothetical protein